MILVTRLNGKRFALNPDLIERIEETPDTVVILIDGTKYLVTEPIEELVDRVVAFRAKVTTAATGEEETGASLRIVSTGADDD